MCKLDNLLVIFIKSDVEIIVWEMCYCGFFLLDVY